jgi:ABC-type lipoprotein export system ATPase subunit
LTIIDLRKRTTMKIKSLHIADFNQFQNFSLDLTYPEGHERAGEPLDKVCIIGQSGTGKTSLLNLINTYLIIYKLNNQVDALVSQENVHVNKSIHEQTRSIAGLTYVRNTLLYSKNFFVSFIEKVFKLKVSIGENYGKIDFGNLPLSINLLSKEPPSQRSPEVFYFSSFNSFEEFEESRNPYGEKTNNLQNSIWHKVFDLSQSSNDFWRNIGYRIKSYHEESIKKRLEISDTEIITEIERKRKSYQEWLSVNKNPLAELGEEFLDKILVSFNLRVKKDIEFNKKEDIGEIQFETLQGKKVNRNILSTGTNQIINTMIPLFSDKPTDALIFFDEPERSLYPDIQTKIVDFYTSLAPGSQFFFATHSPLVASSFDPWEIVELKFKENGTVYQELYYEGERHVNNYNVFPKRLDYSSILTKVFDLPETDRPEKIETLMKIHLLEQQIKEVTLQSEKRELWKEYEKLADSINWKLEDA